MDESKIQKPFGDWAKSIQKRLNYEYGASRSVLNQATILGSIREAVVRDILSKFLPHSIEIGTGQVIDSLGNLSDQIDIIVYRGTTPAFRFEGGVSAFLYEGVLATIEIKSMLYREKLQEWLNNSKSVKELTYLMHIRTKGKRIFEEAFEWVMSVGGLEELERRLAEPSLTNAIGCPEDIWQVLRFVQYWLHWADGSLQKPETYSRLGIWETTEFDFFMHLLQFTLKRDDPLDVITKDPARAEEIKEDFFQSLYEYMLLENLPPATFILAYGGYENPNAMVEEVKNWYEQNRKTVEWYALPKVIMNHKMFMYRHFNEYHCNAFEFPCLFLMNGISNAIANALSIPSSIHVLSDIGSYFDISRILGKEHPKYDRSYLVWSIPIDNSSPGKITAMNQPA